MKAKVEIGPMLKLDIQLGPTGSMTTIVDRENGYTFHPTRIELIIDAKAIPILRMDFEADDIIVNGENIDTELGQATMLAGQKWAEANGFKMVPDDGLDAELGRLPSKT